MHNGLYKRLHYTLVYSPCGTSKLEWIWYQEFRVLIVSWGEGEILPAFLRYNKATK